MREVVPMLKHSVAVAGQAEVGVDLGPPVLLEGEDVAQYERLSAQVTAAVEPADVIEVFWIRDVVDLLWEVLRLRRLKASLLLASAASGLEQLLRPVFGYGDATALSQAWHAGEKAAGAQVDKFLKERGLTLDAITAQTLSNKLDDVERIDRMIANAEARRHVVLREVDRHRAAVAARLRTAAEVIEEGEFEEVPGQGAPQVRAA